MVTLFDDVSFLHGMSGYVRGLHYDNKAKTIMLWLDEANVPLLCRTGWADPVLVKELFEFLRKAKNNNMLITTGVKYGFKGSEWFCAAMPNKIVTARRQFESIYDQEDNWHHAEDELAHQDDGFTEEDMAREEALQHEVNMKILDKKITKLSVELAKAKLACPAGYTVVPKVNGKEPYLCEFDSSSSHYIEDAKDPLLELRQQRYQEEFVS